MSDSDRENLVKAAQCANLLVQDLQALASASNPLLAELGADLLQAAVALEGRLGRLAAISEVD